MVICLAHEVEEGAGAGLGVCYYFSQIGCTTLMTFYLLMQGCFTDCPGKKVYVGGALIKHLLNKLVDLGDLALDYFFLLWLHGQQQGLQDVH